MTHATPTVSTLLEAAQAAGLPAPEPSAGADFHGAPTARLRFPGTAAPLFVEVTEGFETPTNPLFHGLQVYLHSLAGRLRNPHPELYVTAAGLPLRFTGFAWPFHKSTSGADTLIVHGMAQLADGADSPLHAKLSASMTVTFADIIAAPEQPYAEDLVYNAIRKTFDYGQLELVKSGNRQPVPVTTRYYSRWQNHFQFTDTTPESRREFLALKAFWLSGIHGGGAPVWLADPRDAQYLNTTPEDLEDNARALAASGLVTLAPSPMEAYASATPALLAREPEFRAQLAQALVTLKPTFNEQMRAGQTNM